MRKIIDLTEQSPGVWSLALRLTGRKPSPETPEDTEARRERFFDSLAGKSTKRHYLFENVSLAQMAFGLYSVCIVIALVGRLFR
jgi:hypothetical protein